MIWWLSLGLVAATAAGVFAQPGPLPMVPIPTGQPSPRSVPAKPARQPHPADGPAKLDQYGDPLPPGAVARYGTARLRHGPLPAALAFTRDSPFLISLGSDETLRAWDPATGREVGRCAGPVGRVALAPGGTVLLFHGNRLRLWSPADGTTRDLPQPVMPPETEEASAVWVHPNGLVAGVGFPGRVVLIDVRTGNRTAELKTPGDQAPIHLAHSADGRWLAGTGVKTGIWLWDLTTNKRVRTYPATGTERVECAFSPDGRRIAIAGDTLEVYPTDSEEPDERFTAYPNPLYHAQCTPDGRSVIGLREDGGLVRLDAATGEQKESLEPPGVDFRGPPAALSVGGLLAAGIDGSGRIRVWDPRTGKGPPVVALPPLGEVRVSADGTTATTLGADNKVHTFGMADGRHRSTVELPVDEAAMVTWDPRTRRAVVLTGGEQVEVRVIDSDTGKPVGRVPYEGEGQPHVTFDPADPNRVAVFGPGSVTIANLATGRATRSLPLGGPEVQARGGFSPDGRLLATTTRPLAVWELTTGKKRFEVPAVADPADVLFSPDGRLLAAWDTSNAVTVFNLRTGVVLRRLAGGADGVNAAAFGPGGTLFAAGGEDGSVTVWDLTTGDQVRVFAGHDQAVRGVAFSPDGSRLVSTSSDGTALVWDLTAKALAGGAAPVAGPEEAVTLLGAADPAEAQRGATYLYGHADEAVKVLADKLPVPAAVGRNTIDRLIGQLDSPNFATRQAATRDLQAIGGQAAAALRAADQSPSAEVRKAVGAILGRIAAPPTRPGELRVVRAVEVVEGLGTPPARKLLEAWAAGPVGDRLTTEAVAALARLRQTATENRETPHDHR